MRFFCFYILLFIYTYGKAQQLPLLGNYKEYHTVLNPAALPFDYFRNDLNVYIGLSYRNQWSGFEGAPITSILHGTWVGDQSNTKLILGGNLFSDKIGFQHNISLNSKIGVLFSDDPLYGGFSAALSVGYIRTFDDISAIKTSNGNIPPGLEGSKGSPDIGLGVFYHKRFYNEDNIYAGLSSPQLLNLNMGNNQLLKPHFYLLAGYIKFLNDDDYLETSTWVRYVNGSTLSADFNLRFQLDNQFWLGVGGSTAKSIRAELGVVLDDVFGLSDKSRLSFAYETAGLVSPSFTSTFELALNYAFNNRN